MSRAVAIIWVAGALVLALGALRARRMPGRQMLAMVLAWVAIFAILLLAARLAGIDHQVGKPLQNRRMLMRRVVLDEGHHPLPANPEIT